MRQRRFSDEPFGRTVERLMAEAGITYRKLAADARLSPGYVNHVVHENRPVPSNEIIERIAAALSVKPEHFLAYRLRVIRERLEQQPDLLDRLYRRLGQVTANERRPDKKQGGSRPRR